MVFLKFECFLLEFLLKFMWICNYKVVVLFLFGNDFISWFFSWILPVLNFCANFNVHVNSLIFQQRFVLHDSCPCIWFIGNFTLISEINLSILELLHIHYIMMSMFPHSPSPHPTFSSYCWVFLAHYECPL